MYMKRTLLLTSRAKGLLTPNGWTVLDKQRHGDIINSAIRLYRYAIMLGRISPRIYSVYSPALPPDPRVFREISRHDLHLTCTSRHPHVARIVRNSDFPRSSVCPPSPRSLSFYSRIVSGCLRVRNPSRQLCPSREEMSRERILLAPRHWSPVGSLEFRGANHRLRRL